MTYKLILIIASISGALSVSLGAFGAHALKEKLTSTGYLSAYETAVQYHFFHTIVLLFIGLATERFQQQMFMNAGYSLIIGILIFSGSLYVLSVTGIKWLGAITPIGGLAFILAWVFILIGALKL